MTKLLSALQLLKVTLPTVLLNGVRTLYGVIL